MNGLTQLAPESLSLATAFAMSHEISISDHRRKEESSLAQRIMISGHIRTHHPRRTNSAVSEHCQHGTFVVHLFMVSAPVA
ncbi:hypothetical protein TNCV_1153881 [Trichonephila clavipes]|nr:hypothetical protein TNCV_1153881 [Trichonephila clavipes]